MKWVTERERAFSTVFPEENTSYLCSWKVGNWNSSFSNHWNVDPSSINGKTHKLGCLLFSNSFGYSSLTKVENRSWERMTDRDLWSFGWKLLWVHCWQGIEGWPWPSKKSWSFVQRFFLCEVVTVSWQIKTLLISIIVLVIDKINSYMYFLLLSFIYRGLNSLVSLFFWKVLSAKRNSAAFPNKTSF